MEKMIFVNPDMKGNRNIPNIGLGLIATHFNTKVIDFNTKPEPRNRYFNFEVDSLGLSIQSRSYTHAKEIEQEYKKRYPNSKIASVETPIDIQCCYPFIQLKERISFKDTFSDSLPFPNYELFDSFDVFLKNWKSDKWSYAIMTSLGCPFQCIYCKARNRKWFSRSAENSFEELKSAKEKWGIRSFEIIDDVFNLDKKRLLKFCELVKKLKLTWSCVNGLRADLFDEDIAKAMVEAGCKRVGFGVESIDEEVLKKIKKGETMEQIGNAVDIAKKHFEHVHTFFIIGLPGSSYEKDLAGFEWAINKGIASHFSYYIPFDKLFYVDKTFYGEIARPISDEYPKELQEKLYEMTNYMRPGVSFLDRVVGGTKVGLKNPSHFSWGFKKVMGKIKKVFRR